MKRLGVLAAVAFVSIGHADTRIQTETYDKSRVYTVHAQVGRTTLIQLEDDEVLSGSPSSVLGMGDAEAWNLSARGNNIVFKPAQTSPQTNMVIVTNKRTYSFDLDTTPKGAPATYILRFIYPDSEAAKAVKESSRSQLLASLKNLSTERNTDYSWRGDSPLLKPTAAWDDGRFTRLVYDNGAELPAFFKVLPDGTEALVNTSVDPSEPNTIILQEVIRTVRARLGKAVIEIINNNYKLPRFNTSGAGQVGTVRFLKGTDQ